jgi:hypothetical protein
MHAICLTHLTFLDLIILIPAKENNYAALKQFSPTTSYNISSTLQSNILVSIMFLNTVNTCFSLDVRHKFHIHIIKNKQLRFNFSVLKPQQAYCIST